jgi:hypothetical protein
MSVDTEFGYPYGGVYGTSFDLGIKIGVPVLLNVFHKYDVKCTFFLQEQANPNISVVNKYPEVLDQILSMGHEIGLHTHIMESSYFARRREIREGYLRLLGQGIEVKSFRAGWNFTNSPTIKVLEKMKIKYECSPWKNRISGPMSWYNIPDSPYHPSYDDIMKIGTANLLVIPITNYRLGIDMKFPLSLMKKGTDFLIKAGESLDEPIAIHLTTHCWNCLKKNSNIRDFWLRKLEEYLKYLSILGIEKINCKDFGWLWHTGGYSPYYLTVPDIIGKYLPLTSTEKFVWFHKSFVYILSKIWYLLSKNPSLYKYKYKLVSAIHFKNNSI